ncbi:hypothetical protein Zmor_021918 [Zophobas morio]|uniref:THAP domain-containing protein 9 n=1 Tax=Zophobas morio TaxID=2755281 RepID=A0AA38I9J6_9CUCU|nr:hypothetical protein Zmor_021918 [Zophobas morio]
MADKALVFMLTGINNKWTQPIACFFTKSGVKTYQLADLIVKIINVIHTKTEFRVLLTTSDQGGPNRAAVRYLTLKSNFERNDFQYLVNSNSILHNFDACHLIKCLRNAMIDKDIQDDSGIARWNDIEMLYAKDGLSVDSKITKLTELHIHPQGKMKMKVSLATQVFSNSVYSAMTLVNNFGFVNWGGTASFVKFCDTLFDSLNSKCKETKPMRRPLTDNSEHMKFWAEAKVRLNDLKFFKNGKEVHAPPSVQNFIVTIRNIERLWEKLKTLGFKYFATRSIQQDPLENFFGKIRSLCGDNTKPTLIQFLAAYKACMLHSKIPNSDKTNCESANTILLTTNVSSTTLISSASVNLNESPTTSNFQTEQSFLQSLPTQKPSTLVIKELAQIRINTAAYIAGFICRKLLSTKCVTCREALLSDKVTDIHAYIVLKDMGNKLMYPSEVFVAEIIYIKKMIFQKIPDYISGNLLDIDLNINLEFLACEEHRDNVIRLTKYTLIAVMGKHFVKLVNKKLHKRDLRENIVVDTYIKNFAPTVYEHKHH